MARQISGQYKVRSPDLKPLYDKAREMIARLESFSIRHVYREQNREADRLANQAMDEAELGGGSKPISHQPPVPTTNGERHPEARPVPGPPSPRPTALASPKPKPVIATFQDGALHPHTQLPLFDGEEVELEIRRRK